MRGGAFCFNLNDPTVPALSDNSLPSSVDINQFSNRMFRLESPMDANGNQSLLDGTVDAITVVTAPPPPPPPVAPTYSLIVTELRRVGNKHVQVRFTIKNTNGQPSNSFQITSACLMGVNTAADLPSLA